MICELLPECQEEPTKSNTGREGFRAEDGLQKTRDEKRFGVGSSGNKNGQGESSVSQDMP